MKNKNLGFILAILAAFFYGIVYPINKLIVVDLPPFFSTSLLYFGAFIGALIVYLIRLIRHKKDNDEEKLNKKDIPYLIGSALFHGSAVLCLVIGLQSISSSNASLLASFEIISTSLIAFFIFKERITWKLWLAIAFIFVACFVISIGDIQNINFSFGTLMCLLSPLCFGLSNNFMKMISKRNPVKTVGFIGLVDGVILLLISLIIKEPIEFAPILGAEIGVGIVCYGIDLIIYISAQKYIGAAKTSSLFSLAPFIGTILSLIIFQEIPYFTFFIGLGLMLIGVGFSIYDNLTNVDAS